MARTDGLYIKEQIEHLFKAWGCSEPLPKASQQVLICFPPPFAVRVIRVTRTTLKSTYDRPLWRVEFDPPLMPSVPQVT